MRSINLNNVSTRLAASFTDRARIVDLIKQGKVRLVSRHEFVQFRATGGISLCEDNTVVTLDQITARMQMKRGPIMMFEGISRVFNYFGVQVTSETLTATLAGRGINPMLEMSPADIMRSVLKIPFNKGKTGRGKGRRTNLVTTVTKIKNALNAWLNYGQYEGQVDTLELTLAVYDRSVRKSTVFKTAPMAVVRALLIDGQYVVTDVKLGGSFAKKTAASRFHIHDIATDTRQVPFTELLTQLISTGSIKTQQLGIENPSEFLEGAYDMGQRYVFGMWFRALSKVNSVNEQIQAGTSAVGEVNPENLTGEQYKAISDAAATVYDGMESPALVGAGINGGTYGLPSFGGNGESWRQSRS